MTQEGSVEYAYPMDGVVKPYIPKDPHTLGQTRGLVNSAIEQQKNWSDLSPEEQAKSLVRKMVPVEIVSQAATLVTESPNSIGDWTDGHKRDFMYSVLDTEKRRIRATMDGMSSSTDVSSKSVVRERAQRRIDEYTTVQLKLVAHATPNGPARK